LSKKIAFVEIMYHETLLSELSKLFLQLKDVNLTLFVSKEVFKRFDNTLKSEPRITFIQYDVPKISYRTFIKERSSISTVSGDIKERVNKGNFDFVIFETLQGWLFLKASYKELSAIKVKKAAVVHNADVWAGEKRNVPFSIRSVMNDRGSHNYFKKWLKDLDFLITLEDEQTQYLKEKIDFNPSNIITLRCKFAFDNKINNSISDKITFTIPGSVDHLRRDYFGFLKAFEQIAMKHENVHAYLLGRMMETNVRNLILSSDILKSNLDFWDDYVPNNEFNEVISKSHFIVLPVAGIYKYGITKITGPLYDALVEAKPVIISNNVHVNPKYAKSLLVFEDQNIFDVLENGIEIVKNGNYRVLVEEAENVRSLFKPENFFDEILKMI